MHRDRDPIAEDRARTTIAPRIVAVLLFASFCLAYLIRAPSIFQQDWDSLMYGYWAEVKGIHSIWGNHPLGHVLLYAVHAIAVSLGYAGKVLPVHIAANSFFGASTVTLAFLLLTHVFGVELRRALGSALLLGVSATVWRFVPTADVYSLSMLAGVLSWGALAHAVAQGERRWLLLAGLMAGISVLTHQLNAVFLLVAPLLLFAGRRGRVHRFVSFYAAALAVILCGLVLLGHLATRSWSVIAIFEWFRGYLGDPLYGKYLSLDSLPVAARAALRTILVEAPHPVGHVRAALHLVLLGLVVVGLLGLRRVTPLRRQVVAAASLQCLCSGLLIFWFEPFYSKFWMLTLVPFVLALACSADPADLVESRRSERQPSRSPRGVVRSLLSVVPLGLALCVLAFNLRTTWHAHDAEDAQSREAMEQWLAHSTPDDILITAGDLVPQLWFWANRPNTLHLYHQLEPSRHADDRFAYLRDRIDRKLEEGGAVLLAPAICERFHGPFLELLDLTREDLCRFFDGYEREELFSYRMVGEDTETPVYRLLRVPEPRR